MTITVDLAGVTATGAEEDGVAVFRGIRYAEAPVGARRFAPPVGVTYRAGETIDATQYGPWAPQNAPASELTSGRLEGTQDEDCLNLNIWTPAADGGRRPVMVWIHGGAFTSGSGASELYRGARLARRGDVVVVTINYRLGVLGFLAHPDLAGASDGGGPQPRAAGNWGLLDQIAALEWVRDHIAAFGGDPGNVTIFGESAGSMSVTDLLAMPSGDGLFAKAIAQSGPPNAAPLATAEVTAGKLLAEVGVGTFDELRQVPVDRLLAAQAALAGAAGGLAFTPVVDGVSMPEAPGKALAGGAARGVPLLIGTNLDEYKMFIVGDPKGRDPDDEVVNRRIERSFSTAGVTLTADAAIEGYRRIRDGRGASITPRDVWSAIESDRMFRVGSIRAAEAHAAHQPDTYAYLFEWESPAMRGALGACHALEIPFVFGNFDGPNMDRFAGSGPEVERLSAEIMDAWISFARTGRPAAGGLPEWPPYDAGRRATMVFGRASRVENAPLDEERRLWEETA